VQAPIIEQARAALDANQPDKAQSLLQMAAGLGPSPDLATLNQRLTQMQPHAGSDGPPYMGESTLTQTRSIELDYPDEAMRKHIEGWAELSFQVTPGGKVTKVVVMDSSPPKIFDNAAVRAISHMRYKPVLQNGKPILVSSKVRVAFRLAK